MEKGRRKRTSEPSASEEEMEEEEMDGDGDGEKKVRIHVGGLGGSVTEDDLRRMFGGGGTVEGVEIVRTKGRSFAYVDFLPSSDKSLSKLFTTYNGCVWKGGKLKLHKAKEHYLVRLKREWAQDTALLQLQHPKPNKPINNQPLLPSKDPQQSNASANANANANTKQLRIFFPALHTVKALPFTGTGKHKYSFQRVQAPPLPIHFCHCQDHYSPPSHSPTAIAIATATANQNHSSCLENYGINEQELNIMNKVMDKLFQTQNNVSASGDTRQSTTTPPLLPNQQHHHHQLHVATAAAEDDDNIATAQAAAAADDENVAIAADDDNLIINVVSSSQQEENISEFQELRSRGTQASKEQGPSQSLLKAQKNSTGPPKKKRKTLFGDYKNDQNELEAAIPGSKKNLPTHAQESRTLLGAQPDQPESGVQHVSWSQKSSWRQLVGQKGSTSFSVSNVLTGITSSTDQVQLKSNTSEVHHSDSINQGLESNGNVEGQHCETELLDGYIEPQPTKSIAVSNKSGRGASWRLQSSWTQLINDDTASLFSIKQIVPGISFEQQFVPKPKGADALSSTDTKLKEILKEDNDKFTRGEPSFLGTGKEGDVLLCSAEDTVVDNDDACAPNVEKNCDLTPKQASAGNVETGKTCSFMRSASSVKEWEKIKAALSGSLKRKNIEK